jgi:hypothetical protein
MALKDLLRQRLGADFEDLRAVLPTGPGTFDQRDARTAPFIVVHHTVGPADQTWHSIATFHTSTREWPGIGYHFGIRLAKVAYLGDVNTIRANVWGRNHEVIGIALTGDYQNVALPNDYVSALQRLVRTLDEFFGHEKQVVGHQQVALAGHGTVCPGVHLMSVLPTIRQIGSPEGEEFRQALVAEAARQQRVQLNPGAAIQRLILRDGFWVTSHEFDFTWGAATYVAQRAERPSDGAVRVYYVVRGGPLDVKWVPR